MKETKPCHRDLEVRRVMTGDFENEIFFENVANRVSRSWESYRELMYFSLSSFWSICLELINFLFVALFNLY